MTTGPPPPLPTLSRFLKFCCAERFAFALASFSLLTVSQLEFYWNSLLMIIDFHRVLDSALKSPFVVQKLKKYERKIECNLS